MTYPKKSIEEKLRAILNRVPRVPVSTHRVEPAAVEDPTTTTTTTTTSSDTATAPWIASEPAGSFAGRRLTGPRALMSTHRGDESAVVQPDSKAVTRTRLPKPPSNWSDKPPRLFNLDAYPTIVSEIGAGKAVNHLIRSMAYMAGHNQVAISFRVGGPSRAHIGEEDGLDSTGRVTVRMPIGNALEGLGGVRFGKARDLLSGNQEVLEQFVANLQEIYESAHRNSGTAESVAKQVADYIRAMSGRPTASEDDDGAVKYRVTTNFEMSALDYVHVLDCTLDPAEVDTSACDTRAIHQYHASGECYFIQAGQRLTLMSGDEDFGDVDPRLLVVLRAALGSKSGKVTQIPQISIKDVRGTVQRPTFGKHVNVKLPANSGMSFDVEGLKKALDFGNVEFKY